MNNILNLINWDDLDFDHEDVVSFLEDNKEILGEISKQIIIKAIILVKNQEELIKTSIESALKISDELYVFDTGSTDNTVKNILNICKKNSNVILKQLTWENNFAKMRNIAAEATDGFWTIFIDSDEMLQDEIDIYTLKYLLAIIEILYEDFDVCLSLKQTAEDSTVVNWAERIFKNRKSIKYFGFVHEEPRSQKLKKIKTSISIYNLGRSDEELKKFNKEENYYKLLNKNISIEPKYLKWYALMPFNYAISQDGYSDLIEKIYYNLDNMIQDEHDTFFRESLIINYVRCLLHDARLEDALKILSYEKNNYRDNTTMIYYYYLLQNIMVMNISREHLRTLKTEIDFLRDNENLLLWKQYQSIDILEDIMVKLLFKCEEYELAGLLLDESVIDRPGRGIIYPELLLKK